MKTCPECQGKLQARQNKTPEGITYSYSRCTQCGEELVDMKQLHAVAQHYLTLNTV